MKRLIMASAVAAAAILPFISAGAAAAATSPDLAIYPGSKLPLTPVTATTPAEIYTPWGVITDENGTGATVPAQYGGTINGKPIPYPGWVTTSTPHVQLNFAILTTPTGTQDVIETLQSATGSWASDGGVQYPKCMEFTIAATGQVDWMGWTGSSWVNAPGCVLPKG